MQIDITILYKEYYPKLLYYACKFLPCDKQKAEEIVDDVFLKIVPGNFENIFALDEWMYLCVKNKCIDILRPKKTGKIIYDENYLFIDEPTEDRYDQFQVQAEVVNKLYQYIEQLPLVRRRIFELHYFEEKSNAEIAAIMGIKIRTVKNQVTRALKQLRGAFGVEYSPITSKIKELWDRGYSAKHIMYRIGLCHKGIVYRHNK